MSVRLTLYFLIPVVFHVLFCIEYVPDWQLAHLCTVAYMHGYYCCIEYKLFMGQHLFASLLILVCSTVGSYNLDCSDADNICSCSPNITFITILLYTFCMHFISIFYILAKTLKIYINIKKNTEVFDKTLDVLSGQPSLIQTNHLDETHLRLDDTYINSLVESILEQRYDKLDRVEQVWLGLLKMYYQVLVKITKFLLKGIFFDLFTFLFLMAHVLIALGNDTLNSSALIMLMLYTIHLSTCNVMDLFLGLRTFKLIMFKLFVLELIDMLYAHSSYEKEPTTCVLCSIFIRFDSLRYIGNLFLLPYFCYDRNNFSKIIICLQFTIVVAGIFLFRFPEQYESMIDFITYVYYCSILLQVAELKLFARDNITYKCILLIVNTVLGMLMYTQLTQVQKQGGVSIVSHKAFVAFFCSLCMCFNHLVSNAISALAGEYKFTIFTLKDLYKKHLVVRAVCFVIMQLVHISGYYIYFMIMFSVANGTYAAIFEEETKAIKRNIRVGFLHLGLPVTDMTLLLTLFLFGLILVIVSIYIIFRFHFHYRNMLVNFVCGHDDRDLSNSRRASFNKTNDVFLSYSEECMDARSFVLDKLCVHLKNETGLSVTSSEDIVPGQMFHTKLSEKMASCRKVVIVWTKAYEMDENAYRTQFEMLLTPLIKARVFQEHDVYIIRLENAPISWQASLLGDIVEWNFDNSSEEAKLRKFGKKILQSIAEDNCLMNRIQRWFANMIGRMGH